MFLLTRASWAKPTGSVYCQSGDDVVQKSFGGLSPGKFKALPSSCKINQCYGLILSSCHPRDTKLGTDLPLNNLLRLKALDTFGSCQRPGFSLHLVYPNIYA